jgi:hypothetical protein
VTTSFQWTDYELIGPLDLSLGDYTIYAFGVNELMDGLLSRICKIRKRSESVRWMLVEFWGRGKSTLMYNLSHQVNKTLFFSSTDYPTLALYVDHPRRVEDLLDYSYENGLPIPWSSRERVEDVRDARRNSFIKASRMIAYAWVRKACSQKDFDRSLKIQVQHVIDNSNLTNENLTKIVEDVDNLTMKGKYDVLAKLLRSFFVHLSESNTQDFPEPLSSNVSTYLPGLLYPEHTKAFLSSFSNLFGEPCEGLRDFLMFFRVCELANIHLLLVIDEAEDWDYMAKTGLDEFLIEILPTNRLSVVLILRTEVENRLRGIQKRLRYFLVRSYMKRINLQDPSPLEILQIAQGILSVSRADGSLKLFPFTEDFILALSNLTVRGGHFNPRMFLRSLNRILKLSLTWERSNVLIPPDFIKRTDLLEAVVENLRIEDKKELESSVLAKAEEFQKKMEVARKVSECLLSGQVDPPTRDVFEIAKEIVSESFQAPILADIEIIAYTRKEERAKVAQLIRGLREKTEGSPKLGPDAREDLKWLMKKMIKI